VNAMGVKIMTLVDFEMAFSIHSGFSAGLKLGEEEKKREALKIPCCFL
jgi:hypothetical protein